MTVKKVSFKQVNKTTSVVFFFCFNVASVFMWVFLCIMYVYVIHYKFHSGSSSNQNDLKKVHYVIVNAIF